MKDKHTQEACSQSGQSLIEILFAVAIFMIGVVTIGYLILDSQISLRKNIESTQASMLAYEGIEAARAIGRNDFDNMSSGTHGIYLSQNKWIFSSTSDAEGKFTRSIVVSDIDDEIKKIVSTVVWQITDVREGNVSLVDYLTNWRETEGDAADLLVDTTNASLSASSAALIGIDIFTDSTVNITISDMRLEWNNANTLQQITIDGFTVFTAATSSGAMPNDVIDITDYALDLGSGIKTVDSILFNGVMTGTDFVVTFIMDDESRKHVLVNF